MPEPWKARPGRARWRPRSSSGRVFAGPLDSLRIDPGTRSRKFDRACFRTGTDNAFYRCEGETLGVMYGNRFLTAASELPEGADPNEFQVNDEGLLVWVGPGGDWRDNQWGTTGTVNDQEYKWGHPILEYDENGVPTVTRIGDSNPDFRWGISSSVDWKGVSIFGLLDAQVGGDVYNRTNQRMYQYFRSEDTDQAGRSEEVMKTTDYYTDPVWRKPHQQPVRGVGFIHEASGVLGPLEDSHRLSRSPPIGGAPEPHGLRCGAESPHLLGLQGL